MDDLTAKRAEHLEERLRTVANMARFWADNPDAREAHLRGILDGIANVARIGADAWGSQEPPINEHAPTGATAGA